MRFVLRVKELMLAFTGDKFRNVFRKSERRIGRDAGVNPEDFSVLAANLG
jgi:hypothetical protein